MGGTRGESREDGGESLGLDVALAGDHRMHFTHQLDHLQHLHRCVQLLVELVSALQLHDSIRVILQVPIDSALVEVKVRVLMYCPVVSTHA